MFYRSSINKNSFGLPSLTCVLLSVLSFSIFISSGRPLHRNSLLKKGIFITLDDLQKMTKIKLYFNMPFRFLTIKSMCGIFDITSKVKTHHTTKKKKPFDMIAITLWELWNCEQILMTGELTNSSKCCSMWWHVTNRWHCSNMIHSNGHIKVTMSLIHLKLDIIKLCTKP